jgi:hypothetical protein
VGRRRRAQDDLVGIAGRCDATLRCTFIVWDGDVSPEQWRDQARQRFADPAFPPGPLALADLSTAGGAPSITTDAIREMARLWRDQAPKVGLSKLAVIPNGAWDKARQFETDAGGAGLETIIFNSLGTACTWLGLDVDLVRPILDDLRAQLRE